MIYKMKLCKIKQPFTVFTLNRDLTRANADLAFLGLHELALPFSSICVATQCCQMCHSEAVNASAVASTEPLVSEAAAPALC